MEKSLLKEFVRKPTVDRVVCYGDCAHGVKNGEVVIVLSGVSDFNAIKLYDDDENCVQPETKKD